MKWMSDNKASTLEGGAPLGKTRRADAVGVSDTKNNIGGYSIVQAETHDAVAKLFGRVHPHLQMRVYGWKFSKSCRCRECDPPVLRLLSHREGNRATGCASKHGRYGCRDATVSRVDAVPPDTQPVSA